MPKANQPWHENDITEQQLLEEIPEFVTECFLGEDINLNPLDEANKKEHIPGWNWNTAQWHFPGGTPGVDWPIDDNTEKRHLRGTHNYRNNRTQDRHLSVGDWDNLMTYPYIHVKGNTHQGAFMITQEQVKIAEIKCEFLTHRSPTRE